MKFDNIMHSQSRWFFCLALGACLFSCSGGKQGGQPAPADYAVMSVEPSSIVLNASYPAAFKGCQDVEIRPNVSGFITRLCVDEGAEVKKGEVLFMVDDVQYVEAVNVARAAVEVARAQVETARLTVGNKRMLEGKKIISRYDLQMAENSLASAEAGLMQAEARLVNAEKNLSYTRVTSPVDGVMGKVPYRVGSLVNPSMPEPLTVVSDISTMYAYFSMTEKQLLELIRRDSSSRRVLEKMPEVGLLTADGRPYGEKGRIETISEVIDRQTGTVTLRAAFRNGGRLLRSGGSGTVVIPSELHDVLVIPQKASYELQDKRFVYVVAEGGTVRNTEVEVFRLDDGARFVVTSGLRPGDRIVCEGIGSLRDGKKINPVTPEAVAAKLRAVTQPAR